MLLKTVISQVELSYVDTNKLTDLEKNKQYCYETLAKVSRSFAMVIKQLPDDAKEAIGVFYLVLRGLDTIEDDPNLSLENKHQLLNEFCDNLGDYNWKLENVGDKPEYVDLMRQFYRVNHVFASLEPEYRAVIAEKCRLMADGMIDYSSKEINTREEFDEYCYYVAGVVGEGLTGIFYSSGYEAFQSNDLSISMGLFLQKTNIIRDYLEDIESDRVFWPREVWSKYAQKLEDFKLLSNETQSIACVNDLITETLRHIPNCITYLETLKNKSVLRFCAIPQLMALGTLVKLYNNPKVFMSVVKLNKIISMQIVAGSDSIQSIKDWYLSFLKDLEKKLTASDPNYSQTLAAIENCKVALK